MEHTFRGAEVDCVKKLAELFEKGQTQSGASLIGLTKESDAAAVLGMMEGCGIIKNPTHMAGNRYAMFHITAGAVHAARRIEADEAKKQEGEDVVENIKNKFKRNNVIAWGVIAFICFTALATLIASITTILKNFGVLK